MALATICLDWTLAKVCFIELRLLSEKERKIRVSPLRAKDDERKGSIHLHSVLCETF
jgi:hypothetical protein